ncbi:MAG: thiamine pyrophosphate-binding protein [Proteobacteria bacterium]|nr:thiamine pyrophosphate-binding protein [Pseudomonadota bacterium]
MAKIDGGEMLVRSLRHVGVDTVFALSGGHLDPIFLAAADHGIRLIDTRHEAAATHAADGYARATGRMGVAVATAGPGVTNALTGVANAWMDAVPTLLIGGRSPLRDEDRLPLQSMDQIGILKPITKFARTILHPDRIPEYVAAAYRHAVSGRPGPVFLDIPMDILFTPVEEREIPIFERFAPEGRPAPSLASIEAALDALESAERPAIFAGGGVLFSGAQERLREFAELAGIPVFANSKARGAVSERTELGFGSFALATSRPARDLGGGPDVILMLGARCGMFTGSSGGTRSLIPEDCFLIQVDVEAEEIGRNRDVQLGLVGDVNEALGLLVERGRKRRFRDHKRWIDALVAGRDSLRAMHESVMFRPEPPIHQARLAREIAEWADDDCILAVDGGETADWIAEQAVVESAGSYLSHGYLGCLGIGLPFGMAAQAAHPDKRVITILGDGSAGLNFAEFDTLVRHQLPLVVVVNNDQGWGMIRHWQRKTYDRVVGAELGPTRYDLAAQGFGAHAELVTRAEEIRPALERALASGKPACVNVMTDPDQPHRPPRKAKPAASEPAGESKDGQVELPYYGKRELGEKSPSESEAGPEKSGDGSVELPYYGKRKLGSDD